MTFKLAYHMAAYYIAAVSEPSTPNSLGFLLADTARLLRKHFDQRARAIGLTRAQWQVLAYLSHNQGINQSGLADLLEIEPITLSRHLDKMEEAGWVERRPDPSDRRVRLLFISEHSRTVLDEMRSIGRSLLDEAMAGLPPGRNEVMVETLKHIRATLSARPVPDIRASGAPAADSVAPMPKRAAR